MSITVEYASKIADIGAGQKAIINATGQKMSSDIVIAPIGESGTVYYAFNEAYNTATYDFIVGGNGTGKQGVQYADEEIRINEDITVSTHNNGCHLINQLRIYNSDSNRGHAVIHSNKVVSSLMLDMGYKKQDILVFGSRGDGRGDYDNKSVTDSDYVTNGTADNGEWEYIGTITATTTSYVDYFLEIDKAKGYKHILIDPTSLQARIKSMTLTVEGGATGAGETVAVIYNDKRIAEFDSAKTATLECAGKIMQGAVVVIVNSAEEAV